MNLNMLVGSSGRERTAHEYTALLQNSCFSEISFKQLSQTMNRDVILAKKPWCDLNKLSEITQVHVRPP